MTLTYSNVDKTIEKGGLLEEMPEWRALIEHHKEMADIRMAHLFQEDPDRFRKFSHRFKGMLVDYSKNKIVEKTMKLLLDLARASGVETARKLMFDGAKINWTEQMPALHVALRNQSAEPILVDGRDVMPDVRAVLAKMKRFSEWVRSGQRRGFSKKRIRTLINVGIGGSYLGPEMMLEAMRPYGMDGLDVRFIANLDGTDFQETTKDLNPEETLFIIVSKTFSTRETLINAHTAKKWVVRALGSERAIASHFVAVTARVDRALAFGMDPEEVFQIWDWVGGRYSWASAVGLSIACQIGFDSFEEMLVGAYEMDAHFRKAPLDENLPVRLAMIGIWYNNFFGAETHAILPYDQYLNRFAAYFQQGDMESNGKCVDREGNRISYQTGPIIWGEPGTNSQHSFFQLMHQGTKLIPADFIGCVNSHNWMPEHHLELMANFFAQTEALMMGRSLPDRHKDGGRPVSDETLLSHKTFPGDRPTNSILIEKLTPRALGRLISLYEMKIFVQGIVWRINSFDQWGVELGKELATVILEEEKALLSGKSPDLSNHNVSTQGLLKFFVDHLEKGAPASS